MRKQLRVNIVRMMIILAISLMMLFLLLYFFMQHIKNISEKESLNLVLETTEQLNYAFQSRIDDAWMELDMVQESVRYVAEQETGDVSEILYKMRECAEADQVFLLDSKGNYINAEGNRGSWKSWDMSEEIQETISTKERTNLLRHDSKGKKRLVFVLPMKTINTGELKLEYMIAEYELDSFLDVIQLELFAGRGKTLIVDGEGECVLQMAGAGDFSYNYTFFHALEGENILYNEEIPNVKALKESMKAKKRGAVCVSIGDERIVLSYVPMRVMDWSLVLLVDYGVISSMKNNDAGQLGEIAFLLIFLVLAACFVGYLFMNFLTDKRAGQLLRNRESLMNIISSDTMGVYVLASEGDAICRYATSDLMPILGISEAELIGKSIFETLNQLGLEDLVKQMQEWDRKKNLEVKNISYIHPVTKEEIYLRCKCFVPNAGEVAVSIIDETLDVQRELALRAAVNAAEAASNSKSKFLSSMSHDMRTPMNAIIGLSTLLDKNAEDPKRVKNYAKKITASSQQLLGIINDILDMNKIESGKVKLNIEEFHLAAILEDIQAIIMPQIEARNQKFEIKTSGIKEEHLMGDQVRINQILLNLLSNAVKYTPDGGTITLQISTVVPKPVTSFVHLRFKIIDDGMGMSEDFLNVIFEPFAREENSTISGIQGTGLGMSITHNLVKMMGGNIFVKSKPGIGTTFTVDLKFRPAETKKDSEPWSLYGISRILVASDKVNQCIDIQNVMSETDTHIEYVTNANCVMRLTERVFIGELFYDMLLLDQGIKGMDVLALVKKVRVIMGKEILIIMLTDYEWSDEEKEKAVGVDGFLTKPFFLSNLKKMVAQIHGDKPVQAVMEEKMSFSDIRFLVAEDNEINAEVLQELLAEEGAEMDIVENGKLALEKFQDSEPGYYDMVLMDVQMPVMNGYDASRAIRKCGHPDAENIPIVAMTANAFMEDIQEALNAGMNAHVAKPVNMNVFKESALNLLAKKKK